MTPAPRSRTSTSRTATRWPADVHTLAIDVGGTGLKAAVLDAAGAMATERLRVETPYPCPPTVLIPALATLATSLQTRYDRVSVGFPGLVRGGLVYNIPALSRRSYLGETDPVLVAAWHGFDLAGALSEAFSVPVKVANDADVQGCAVVTGHGFEFVITLGTGVGTSLFSNGILLPHLELGHTPFRKGESFEDQLGNAARKAVGNERWAVRVGKAIEAYDQFLFFDRVYLGGGNSAKLTASPHPKAQIVSNNAGITGGLKIWNMDIHN
jgi:polyphosphate glucokinase